MEEKIEALAANIYAQLAVAEFYRPNGMSYKEMKIKAIEAATSFYKKIYDGTDLVHRRADNKSAHSC